MNQALIVMKLGILLSLLTLNFQCLRAELTWHEFDVSDSAPQKVSLDGAVVEIVQRDVEGAVFKEDNLTLVFSGKGSTKNSVWLTSSYGMGAIAMDGQWLFLRYGIGRGTYSREEHVRVYRVDPKSVLEEMADVKISWFVDLAGPNSGEPTHVEYKIQARESEAAMTVNFIPPIIDGLVLPEKSLRVISKRGGGESESDPSGSLQSSPEDRSVDSPRGSSSGGK